MTAPQNALRCVLAQINPHVGALEYNSALMLAAARQAQADGADLIVYPEMSLSGYPPEDLLHKPHFIERMQAVERQFQQELAALGMSSLYGTVRLRQDSGKTLSWSGDRLDLMNVGVAFVAGQEVGWVAKWHLPNHSVFDEQRYFFPGTTTQTFSIKGFTCAVTLCEDIWHADGPLSQVGPVAVIFTLNASPYHVEKWREREAVVRQRIQEKSTPILYVNMVGGQDELVFDGGSFAMSAQGEVLARAACCQAELLTVDIQRSGSQVVLKPGKMAAILDREQEIYQALCLGIKDYVRKNRFPGVILGLSGGIDSALTAVICVDALGAEQVETAMMPSPFTSVESLEDAAEIARRLGIRLASVAIDPLFIAFKAQLAEEFQGLGEDVTEENLQPRIRATLLMAISNKKGKLLVSTGNKSEISVGYATLYGDMAGGFSVLKDVLKETVYRLSHARNQWAVAQGQEPPIPQRVLEKEPTAELKHGQKDVDSLPAYEILDRILQLYIEEERDLAEIVATGLDHATVLRVLRLVDRNEYKRRQSVPGVRITRRAFGKDRRYPITNGFVRP